MLHVVISQSSLSAAIPTVSRAVASRPTHPILGNIKLVADEESQTLTLTGFDLKIGLEMTLDAKVLISGAITLPSKLLGDIVSRLPDEDVTLKTEDNIIGLFLVNLSCGSGKYQLNGLPVEEFPSLPNIDSEDSFDVDVATLKAGLAATLSATSVDETKRILTGVCVTSKSDSLEFAATDGHRLSVFKTSVEDGQEFLAVIPAKALQTLEKWIGNQEKSITMRADRANAIFALPNGTLITRLLDGTYPNYRQLIPTRLERTVTLERKLFLSALERISVLADQKNNVVKIAIDATAQEIALSVEAPDIAAGRESLPAQISGDDLEVAFNAGYLKQGLQTQSTNEVQLQFNNATSPSLLIPIGGIDQVYLLMPVQIR